MWYNRDMTESYYFYDLETSGLSPRGDRIMQFAGMRTDLQFRPLGEPHNILVELADDTLPGPYAIMTTKITPQKTREEGYAEREFCRIFLEEVALPGTTIIGYNSVRFDDEFMRHTLWRNFCEPYEWQYAEGRSRWDMLDVVRMVRALRPEGMKWPVTAEGRATNRLELLTKENGLKHEHAHDAFSDVEALVQVTQLIAEKQPQMFGYLKRMRKKELVADLVTAGRPFVYTSGRYPSEVGHTTVAIMLAPVQTGAVVFDLRYNVEDLLAGEAEAKAAAGSEKALLEAAKGKPWRERDPWEKEFFPIVKTLQFNRCPAVAPLGVLDKEEGWRKISLSPEVVQRNQEALARHPEFVERVVKKVMARKEREFPPAPDAESALYDGFLADADRRLCKLVQANDKKELKSFQPEFQDERLKELFLHYRAKNFAELLSEEERKQWEEYRQKRLEGQAEGFRRDMQELQKRGADEYLLQELLLWYEAVMES